jgi:hypothetical protein
VENNIIKLKLFPFSLSGKAKEWLLSLPTTSINSWDDLKEYFIKSTTHLLRYYKIEKTSYHLGKMTMNMQQKLGRELKTCLELAHHME